MKRSVLLFCIVSLAAPGLVEAQDKKDDHDKSSNDARRALVFGFKAGVNRSTVFDASGDQFVADPKPGFMAGVFAAIPFGSYLGFQPEIHLSQKGFEGSGVVAHEPYLLRRTTTHLDIPLQLQVKPFSFVSVLGGVAYSYLLHTNDHFTFSGNAAEQQQAFNDVPLKKSAFCAITGIDVNVGHFVLGGRAAWDLISINNSSSSVPRYKNMWLQLAVGYRIY